MLNKAKSCFTEKKLFLLIIISFSLLTCLPVGRDFNCFSQQLGWEIVPSGTTKELNSIFFYDYEVGFACGNSGTVIKTIDSGKTWQTIPTSVTNDLNDLFVFNDSSLCVVGDSGTILFSVEGGNNWYIGPYFLTENYYSVSFSGTMGILGGSSQTIVQAEFGGTNITFFEVQSGLFGGGFWDACMLSPLIGFVAGENSIFQPLFGKSTDSGFNWDFTTFYLNGNEGKATGIDFTDMSTGYVSGGTFDLFGAIAKTTNNGNDWVTTLFPDALWDINFPISDASLIGYACGDDGIILKTYNAGGNWLTQQTGTTLILNKIYFMDLDNGYAVGENGIILKTNTGGEPATFVENENQAPHSFELFQNYPNPFNPSTRIKYQVSSNSHIALKVYDVLGNEIATLVDEEKSPGNYEVEFNPTSSIRYPASGIYFYQLKAGDYLQTKKMILLK